MSARLADVVRDGKRVRVAFDCPGCKGLHAVPVAGDGSEGPTWAFNENYESPTLKPSLLTRRQYGDGRGELVCHLFVTDGQLQFLGDCSHELRGQTVPMAEVRP